MPNHENLVSLLGADPVMQAMFEAERCAFYPLQLDFLDAVLTDDHRKVSEMLEHESHNRLLPDDFFLCISILLVANASPKVIKAFVEHGYDGRSTPSSSSSAMSLKMGDIALSVSAIEQQQVLVDTGFLAPDKWAYVGMKNAKPEVFDFWFEQYKVFAANRQRERIERNAANIPGADNYIFAWLPDVGRQSRMAKQETSSFARREIQRRLDKHLDFFLDLHYPAPDEQARWSALMDRPFNIENYSTEEDAVLRFRCVLEHQLARTPNPRAQPIQKVSSGSVEILWSALLDAGFELPDFDFDLAGACIDKACDLLASPSGNLGEGWSMLWSRVARKLTQDDPQRAGALPKEFFQPFFSLRSWMADIEGKERSVRGEELSLSFNTAPAPLPGRPAPRL